MKSRWLPTLPLNVADWMSDPIVRRLPAHNRAELIDALCQSWMLGDAITVDSTIRAAYLAWWPPLHAHQLVLIERYDQKAKRAKNYRQRLKDPRWQKKRLGILERDGWKCRRCGATDRTLQVHHLSYSTTGQPWDVTDESLMTLCDDCHGEEGTGRDVAPGDR